MKSYFELRDRLNQETKADMVLSPTYDMPRSAVLYWAFTPCAGFFSIEPSPGGKALAQEWLRMTKIMFDDQIAIAELVYRKGGAWDLSAVEGVDVRQSITTLQGGVAEVIVLSPTAARRVGAPDPSTIGGATIWHPRWVIDPEQHGALMASLASESRTL
jgi:hypothetical protein